MNSDNIIILRPFGPAIAKVKIPEEIIKKLNNYFEDIISDDNKYQQQDHGQKLAGNVKKEIKIEQKIAEESGWLNFLGLSSKKYIESSMTGQKITKFTILDSWIVSQFKNEYNPTHWHGGHISGAGYLKVPKNLGKPIQSKKPFVPNGCLQLIHGSKQFLSNSTLTIKPEVGDFYFFPNYMMHTVFPFSDTDEERRCVSFNAIIDENVYNVYGG